MLLPVGAVSAVGVSIDKPIAATAETSGLQTTATPIAVLSSAVNTSVEGKLNMLLVAARERMLDSLLSAIDAASKAVNVSREPGESNTAYAQRVAAAIRSLPPPQLAAAQQQMDAQMTTRVPLPLLAAALENPESPQAIQLALSLEQASAGEPDAALKAVVNSYGQNAGNLETPARQASASATLQKAADMAALATTLAAAAEEPAPAMPAPATTTPATAQPAAQPTPAGQQTPQPGMPAQPASAAGQTTQAQTAAQNGTAVPPQAASAGNVAAVASPVSPSVLASLVDDLTAGVLLTAIAAEAKLPTEVALIRSPLTPPPVPRDIQQIEADIKQGLQIVISPPIMATDADLLQIINNPSSSVEKIIAQALTGNAATQAQSATPPTVNEGPKSVVPATAMPVTLMEEPEAPVAAALSAGKTPPQMSSAAPMAMYEAAEQAGMSAPLPLGVPFVVANYLPADAPVKNDKSKLLDRVDPVGDEEGGQAQDEETPQDQDENEAHAEERPAQAIEEASDEAEEGLASRRGDSIKPELAALPQPLRDPLHDHAFDFYRRMVAWE
ncbi:MULTISPECIES: hypothetical protein [unclassified Rhizobium]|jgi:hypothetical protein|uniref:hypothetical protein n=1 Tax=unclassified Rhizobium TaxID=2613769 RepID=UPI0006484AF0|nr:MULTISPECIES: hypothetical protein [unclassified Rhizobium]MBN8953769.1 hypothetical protein [Rhizobium tropici]OJY72419.1 MAG: hypothetical protein BGP09_04735 [Rhizobium sp. 60-20]RKD50837.1 hypothetical protein BJ928_11937 [Rhizobium sp. WW_1]